MAKMAASLRFLQPQTTAFFLCDIQEAFRKVMPLFNNLLTNTNKLLAAGKILDIPLFVSEQYPERLGKTAQELDICHACAVIEKTQFSMLVPEMKRQLNETFLGENPKDVVLFGMETHVCVEQTAIDLISNKINVFLVADCSCSRSNQDRDLVWDRLRQMGCSITTSEAIIFNILRGKDHPKFQDILKLIRTTSADMAMATSVPKPKKE